VRPKGKILGWDRRYSYKAVVSHFGALTMKKFGITHGPLEPMLQVSADECSGLNDVLTEVTGELLP
jgi:hypothetical protein